MEIPKSQIIEAKIKDWLKQGNAKIAWDTATMKEIMAASRQLAKKYGELIGETFNMDSILDDLPELQKTLQNLRSRAADSTRAEVAIQNENSEINIKAQAASKKSESISNLIERIRQGTYANDGSIADSDKFLIDKSVLNHIATEGCVDTLEENAALAADAGIETMYIRHLGPGGCCPWCQRLAGSYTYWTLPDDFWRTHDNCDCWIEYKTEKVHHKITYTNRDANGKKRKITSRM